MDMSQSPLSAIERQLVASLGLSADNLGAIKDTFNAVNQTRLSRAQAILSERQRQVLLSLPSLLDCNHPMLPGYVSRTTPCGIYDFNPNKEALSFIRTLAKSFQYNRLQQHYRKDILGVFLMGSVGTIAHSETSDIDLWVCFEPSLSDERISELKLKCEAIEHWALEYNLEIHFFLMDWQRHLQGEQSAVDTESSGSTQYYLLLDEFYRSAIHLAGCLPIWLFVSGSDDKHYAMSKKTIHQDRLLGDTSTIDLGNVNHIPPQEFLTAAIWQLYKAIESPYKSILKLLLLEAYAAGNEKDTLSHQFKSKLHELAKSQTPIDANEFDPYLRAYRIIENYLIEQNQGERLDLIRRCFYIKVGKLLTKPPAHKRKSWQRQLMEQLVDKWGWPISKLQELDSRDEWKAPDVKRERKHLIEEMNRSYQVIVSFWRQHNLHLVGNNKDLNLLGRKLQAAFGRKSGKIDIVNSGITKDISESKLFFKKTNDFLKPWVAYSKTGNKQQAIVTKKHLAEVIAWCFYNKVLTTDTQCYCDDIPPGAIMDIARLLKTHLHVDTDNESSSFEKKPAVEKMLVLVHTSPEQEASLHTVTKLTGKFSALNFGGTSNPLIRQIDCIYVNEWNEIYCQSFKRSAIVEALTLLLRSLRENHKMQYSIHCINSNYRLQIEQQFSKLCNDLSEYCIHSSNQHRSRVIVDIYGAHQTIEFDDNRPIIRAHEDADHLIDFLGQPHLHFIKTHLESTTLQNHPLRHFVKHNSENTVQIFYEAIKNNAVIYLFDEKGTFVKDTIRYFRHPDSLKLMHHFLRNTSAQNAASKSPASITPIIFYELHKKKNEYVYSELAINSNIDDLPLIRLSALCDIADDELVFHVQMNDTTYNTDGQESSMDALALAIIEEQKTSGIELFGITALDLSKCQDYLSENGQLYASHYLHVKGLLEKRIRAALKRVKSQATVTNQHG